MVRNLLLINCRRGSVVAFGCEVSMQHLLRCKSLWKRVTLLSCCCCSCYLSCSRLAVQSFATNNNYNNICRRHGVKTAKNHRDPSGLPAMSLSDNNNNNNDKDKPAVATSIHVLALHGSEGSAQEFRDKIVKELADKAGSSLSVHHKPTWHVTAVNAPFVKGNGFAWWLNAPGVRSYNAVEYPGIDESIAAVTQALAKQPRGVDLIVAHSQGAILTLAMLAQGILSKADKNKSNNNNNHPHHHPRLGYILNGGAWPNPYTAQLESLQLGNSNNVRVCAITGQADTVNPPETQQRVTEALSRAGATVTTITHSAGHSVPVRNDNVVQQVLEWVAEGESLCG